MKNDNDLRHAPIDWEARPWPCGRRSTTSSGNRMLYAILCYDSEDVVGAWTKEQDDTAMQKLGAVQEKLAKQGKLGPVARLLPTTAATTLRKGKETMVLDGPFAETKEQLLGFFVVECSSLEDALETARELGRASSSNGCYEIRPIGIFNPGIELAAVKAQTTP